MIEKTYKNPYHYCLSIIFQNPLQGLFISISKDVPESINLKIDGSLITKDESPNYLKINLDSRLKWTDHNKCAVVLRISDSKWGFRQYLDWRKLKP